MTAIHEMLETFANIERGHYRIGSDRRENDSEHSLSVAVIAWYLHGLVKSKTDLGLVIKYSIIHDFVEVYAGDVNAFAGPKARVQKEIDERKALNRFNREFKYFPGLLEAMNDYQDMKSPEARFVWACDKIQHYIYDDMNDWKAHTNKNVDLTRFDERLDGFRARSNPELLEVLEEVIKISKRKYRTILKKQLAALGD